MQTDNQANTQTDREAVRETQTYLCAKSVGNNVRAQPKSPGLALLP